MNSTSKIVFAVLAIMALLCFASALGTPVKLPIDANFAWLSGTLFTIAALSRL
jgi:hypothetical protein